MRLSSSPAAAGRAPSRRKAMVRMLRALGVKLSSAASPGPVAPKTAPESPHLEADNFERVVVSNPYCTH